MKIPAPDEFQKLGEVFIQWGFGFIAFGFITMLIGFIILACLDIKTIKKVSQFLNN